MTHAHLPEKRWLHSVPSNSVQPHPSASLAHPHSSGQPHSSALAWPDAAPEGPSLLDGLVPFGRTSRVLTPELQPQSLDVHVATYGPRPSAAGTNGLTLLDTLQVVALTGRGGGHFPVASKWRTALSAGGGGIVVANGAEGEPASVKDAALLQLRPHLVLDGLALAAETVGAWQGVVWLHEGDHATHNAVARAISERRARGDLGLDVRIVLGPDHYLTGESSAIVNALSGGSALPTMSRRPAAISGVGGRPSVIHNAETLARVALVARFGVDADLEGALVSVLGPHGRVVTTVQPGETFAGLIARTGGRPSVQAVLVGGYGGSWLPWSAVAGVQVTEAAMRRLGVSLGAGVVAPLPVEACGVVETARVLAYLAASSARQCGPCLFGLPDMADLVARIASGRCGRGDLKTLDRFMSEVAGRGACHHPDGAVRLAISALRTFDADVRRHVSRGPCAGATGPAVLPIPEVG